MSTVIKEGDYKLLIINELHRKLSEGERAEKETLKNTLSIESYLEYHGYITEKQYWMLHAMLNALMGKV